jgi:5-methyltetrahydropteroyltriglutamate--homocysteine methyltransferase
LVRIYESNLPEIIEYVLKINAGSFSFEAANPRHEHEYHLFERMKIPEGKVLCPAPSRMPVTSSSTPPT